MTKHSTSVCVFNVNLREIQLDTGYDKGQSFEIQVLLLLNQLSELGQQEVKRLAKGHNVSFGVELTTLRL